MDKSDIKLSIVIPIYKVEKYLSRCIDSLLGQSLKDIELICVNDGSPDNCLSILKEYKKKYGDKIVIINKENEGIWKARIDGIKEAKGEYIGFLDSDDYVSLEFAEKLYTVAKNTNSDIVVCGYNRMDMETGERYASEMCKKRRDILMNKNPEDIISLNGAPWNKIFKSKALKEIENLESSPKILEDVILQFLACFNINKITFIPDILVYYMVRKDSNVNSIHKEKLSTAYIGMLETKNICLKNNKKDIFIPILDAIAYLHLGISMMFRISYDENYNLKQTIKDNEKFLDENFNTWRKVKFFKLSYIIKNKGSNFKMGIMNIIYKLKCFRLFLIVYKFMIDKFKIDIKW